MSALPSNIGSSAIRVKGTLEDPIKEKTLFGMVEVTHSKRFTIIDVETRLTWKWDEGYPMIVKCGDDIELVKVCSRNTGKNFFGFKPISAFVLEKVDNLEFTKLIERERKKK